MMNGLATLLAWADRSKAKKAEVLAPCQTGGPSAKYGTSPGKYGKK